jgi:hypothetical protein
VLDDSSHFEVTDQSFSEFDVRSNIYFFFSTKTEKECNSIIQPLIFESPKDDGNVFALFRTGCGVIAQARSKGRCNLAPCSIFFLLLLISLSLSDCPTSSQIMARRGPYLRSLLRFPTLMQVLGAPACGDWNRVLVCNVRSLAIFFCWGPRLCLFLFLDVLS